MFKGQVLVEGGQEVPRNILDDALRCAGIVSQTKAWIGAAQYTKAFELSDGYQLYVIDLDHVQTIHIIPPRPAALIDPLPTPQEAVDSTDDIPIISFVSGGAHTGAMGFTEEGESKIINDRVELISGGAARLRTAQLFTPKEVAVKVGVPQHYRFQSMFDQMPRTQLHPLQPGRFTGAMASVVQLLLGVGKIRTDDYENRFLDAMELPGVWDDELVMTRGDEITLERPLDDVGTIALRDTEENEDRQVVIQLAYDYRWNRTHGIVWGDRDVTDELLPDADSAGMPASMVADPGRKKEPFLVEIGQRGLFVTPLPRDEASFFEQVRAQYLMVYPELGQYTPFARQTLFDGLGGFPTGGALPGDPDELDRLVRAGIVVEADCDLSMFYEGAAFCTAHGWAFGESQAKAINTCYKSHNGIRHGYCYEVRMDISQRPNLELNPRSEAIVGLLGLNDFVDFFKAARLTDEQIDQLLDSESYDEFDGMEVEPDWIVDAAIREVVSGPVDSYRPVCARGGNPCDGVGPQYKVWEPVFGIPLTFDFYNHELRNELPNANGPIFATYVGDQPEILRFFQVNGGSVRNNVNTRQPCQYTGSWQSGHETVQLGDRGTFYSTTLDPRVEGLRESGSIRNSTARELGRSDYAGVCAFFAMSLSLTRRVYGTITWDQRSWSGGRHDTSVVCARNNRSAFFVGVRSIEYDVRKSHGFSGRQHWGNTGTTVVGSLYNFVFHWTGGCGRRCHGSGDAQHYFTECSQSTSFSCFGPDRPSELNYYAAGGNYHWNPLVVHSPVDNAIIQQAHYTSLPKAPKSWSESEPPRVEVNFKVYGMGLPEMNGRVLRAWQESAESVWDADKSHWDWWQCSWWDCPAMFWGVLRNYYGTPFVITSEEFGSERVEYGKPPRIDVGPDAILFGVVD